MNETIKLHYSNAVPDDIQNACSEVWEQLYQLARNEMLGYFGDLYHDAIWLHRSLKGTELTFYYSCNNAGTTIGLKKRTLTRDTGYRITVSAKNSKYTMHIQGA